MWAALVPLTAVAAGALFATSASTAQGTDLRADRRLRLTELIAREQQDVARQEAQPRRLRASVERWRARRRAGHPGAPSASARAPSRTPWACTR
jgi:uncharacterized protein YlxW (UPF0749 family)